MLSTKPDSWNMTDFIPDLIIMVTPASLFDGLSINRGKYVTVFLDFSIHPNIWQLWGQISPVARKLQH